MKNGVRNFIFIIALLTIISALFPAAFADSTGSESQLTADQIWNKAMDYMKQGKNTEALSVTENGLTTYSNDYRLWNIKGGALLNLDRYQEALESFNKSLEIEPTFDKAWYNKGITLNKMGRYSQAVLAFDQTLKINPDFSEAVEGKKSALAGLSQSGPGIPSLSPTSTTLRTPAQPISPVVSPVISKDEQTGLSEMIYDDGRCNGYYGISPKGHAVYFSNNKKILVKGVKVFSGRYDNTSRTLHLQIWNKDLTTLYDSKFSYDDLPFQKISRESDSNISWTTIPVQDFQLDNDFYIVLFTDSKRPTWDGPEKSGQTGGIRIGLDTDSWSGNSYIVQRNPNSIADWTVKTVRSDTDWMIRVVYFDLKGTSEKETPSGIIIVFFALGVGVFSLKKIRKN